MRRVCACQITEALKSNAGLEALDVGGNNIDAEGIAVLMAALRGNTVLKTLELGYNPIEEKGAEELSAAIKYDLPVRCGGSTLCARPIAPDEPISGSGVPAGDAECSLEYGAVHEVPASLPLDGTQRAPIIHHASDRQLSVIFAGWHLDAAASLEALMSNVLLTQSYGCFRWRR